MKNLMFENLSELVLSNEEMINVRGGNGSTTNPTTNPPVIVEI